MRHTSSFEASGLNLYRAVDRSIGIVQSKYLNNIVEQGHRFIKRITRPRHVFLNCFDQGSMSMIIDDGRLIVRLKA